MFITALQRVSRDRLEQVKTLEANVVKSLFAVLSKLSLKVLQCHRRQTKRFFGNFLAIFCAFGASNGTCQVWCKSRHKWPNYGQKRFDLTTSTCHKKV